MKKVTIIELFLAQEGKCFYCFEPMVYMRGQAVTNYTVDHFLPKCRGNKTNNNIVLCCPRCNLNKGHRMPTDSEEVRKGVLYGKIQKRRERIAELNKIGWLREKGEF